MSINSDVPLKATCAVCGKAVASPLEPLPPAGGNQPKLCGGCGKTVCAQHFSNSRKRCVRCTSGRDDWCKTPKLPETPKLPKLPGLPGF